MSYDALYFCMYVCMKRELRFFSLKPQLAQNRVIAGVNVNSEVYFTYYFCSLKASSGLDLETGGAPILLTSIYTMPLLLLLYKLCKRPT